MDEGMMVKVRKLRSSLSYCLKCYPKIRSKRYYQTEGARIRERRKKAWLMALEDNQKRGIEPSLELLVWAKRQGYLE
jgi:hypothetical protein